MCPEASLLVGLEPVRLTLSVSHGYTQSRGLRAAGGKHLSRGQMITSQEERAQPGQVALAKKRSKEGPRLLEPALLGLPLLPQLGCTLPHSCLFLPCAQHGRRHSGGPWAVLPLLL